MKLKKITCFLLAQLLISFSVNAQLNNTNYIDHAGVLKSFNAETLERGKMVYLETCSGCHGEAGIASYPQARSFAKEKLHFGSDPYKMWTTITYGAGLMPAQTNISAEDRYYVIQYIRENFMKNSNRSEYFKITDEYLRGLPKSNLSPREYDEFIRKEALVGSQVYGPQWFKRISGDYGKALYGRLSSHTSAGLTVFLSDSLQLNYDLLRLGTTAAWRGTLDLSESKYQNEFSSGQPVVKGRELEGLGMWQWTYGNRLDSLTAATGPRTPLSRQFMDYRGHYVYNKEVILSYSIMGRHVLEYPQAITVGKQTILSQTLEVSAGNAQTLYIGQITDGIKKKSETGLLLVDPASKKFISVGIVSENKSVYCDVDKSGRIVLNIPASRNTFTCQVLRASGIEPLEKRSFQNYVQRLVDKHKLPQIKGMTRGGQAQWQEKITLAGRLAAEVPHFDPVYASHADKKSNPEKLVTVPKDYPYTVDNIDLPYDNSYRSWIRPASLSFKKDGTLVIGTYAGDVWIAKGIDKGLKKIVWQRIATGLDECLGLKVVQDQIYVTTHLGIIRLRDLNADDETDFYEMFFPDQDVSYYYHSFNFGLETDSKGNFFYTKNGGYTSNKDPGNVIKVSPDGKQWESIATGFRTPAGITITPDDRIFVSDNQGQWIPAGKINLVEKGKYYGFVNNLTEGDGSIPSKGFTPNGVKLTSGQLIKGVVTPDVVRVPERFDPPAIWLPQELDNSAAGGVWSDNKWGPLGNRYIHTSFGTGWMYYFLPQKVGNVTQGAMIPMPFTFQAGIMNAAVNPVDKDIYVVGLNGVNGQAVEKYGSLARMRYKGRKGHLITDAQVVNDGLKLTFNFKLDRHEVQDLASYQVVAYNYKWTINYGSAHYSINEPDKEGEDTWIVSRATVSDDENSVILQIPDIRPAQTVRVRFKIRGMDGVSIKESVYFTILATPK